METKLTLKLDESIIEQAKEYASIRKKSLSRLVEDYFRGLGNTDARKDDDIDPIVKEISGIIGKKDILGWENGYSEFLRKKYE